MSDRHGHCRCLLCGTMNPWSLRLGFRPADDGTARAEFRADSKLQGYDGILHGGVIAALLDAAMTHCLFHRGIEGLTGDLHVRFVRPVPCDAVLDIQATLLSSTPHLHHLKAELRHGARLMARAEAKFVQLRTHGDGHGLESNHSGRQPGA